MDANAISPLESRKISELFGAAFVDGGIIGPPAKEAGTTRIYLSGMRSREVVDLFKVGPLEAIALSESSDPEEITAASALKWPMQVSQRVPRRSFWPSTLSPERAVYWRRCTKNGKFRPRD